VLTAETPGTLLLTLVLQGHLPRRAVNPQVVSGTLSVIVASLKTKLVRRPVINRARTPTFTIPIYVLTRAAVHRECGLRVADVVDNPTIALLS
jgi:hypothetical protein